METRPERLMRQGLSKEFEYFLHFGILLFLGSFHKGQNNYQCYSWAPFFFKHVTQNPNLIFASTSAEAVRVFFTGIPCFPTSSLTNPCFFRLFVAVGQDRLA